jgi:hypothetical protein
VNTWAIGRAADTLQQNCPVTALGPADFQLLGVGGAAATGCSADEPAVPRRAQPQFWGCQQAAGAVAASVAAPCTRRPGVQLLLAVILTALVELQHGARATLTCCSAQVGGRTGVEGPGLVRGQRIAYGLLILLRYAWTRAGSVVARAAVRNGTYPAKTQRVCKSRDVGWEQLASPRLVES